jgi:hypothetical protein
MLHYLEILKTNKFNKQELIKCIKLAWAVIATEQINASSTLFPVALKPAFAHRIGIPSIKV